MPGPLSIYPLLRFVPSPAAKPTSCPENSGMKKRPGSAVTELDTIVTKPNIQVESLMHLPANFDLHGMQFACQIK